MSTSDYHHALNQACAESNAFSLSLPSLQQRDHLSVHELQLRADKEGASFRSTLTHLSPPSDLSSAHHALIADLDRGPKGYDSGGTTHLPVLVRYEKTLLHDYTALGATGCEANTEQALSRLSGAGS